MQNGIEAMQNVELWSERIAATVIETIRESSKEFDAFINNMNAAEEYEFRKNVAKAIEPEL